MASALVLKRTKVIPYSKVENQQITMRASYLPEPDNNVLSTVSSATGYADWMQFFWKNFY
jgi:hypothetical protein